MIYSLYLCKTDERNIVPDLFDAFTNYLVRGIPDKYAEELKDFNAETAAEELRQRIGDRAKIYVSFPREGLSQHPFLRITTSFARAKEILPEIIAIAYKYHLVLWDAGTGKALNAGGFIEESYIDSMNRAKQIYIQIRAHWLEKKILLYSRIVQSICKDETSLMSKNLPIYVLGLRKKQEASFEERVEEFYTFLHSCLLPNENLICKRPCFIIDGGHYSITFYLEGYNKRASLLGYMENGHPVISLMRRMNYRDMLDWLENASEYDYRNTLSRLENEEMSMKYDDLLDRLAASIRLTKKQNKDLRRSHI
ncbi:MAG: hypothetical protein IKH57_23230 [Clostridia bacterium]|nr:hypothetical protein [Clostridia bacterium]